MENKVIAKIVWGPDDGTFMYKDLPQEKICTVCHSWLGEREINLNFRASTRKKACLRATYDGFVFVSEEFRQFCLENKYPDLEFTPFPKSIGNYYLYPKMLYPLDAVRRNVKFIRECPVCGNYEEVIGSVPSFTQSGFILPSNDFIYRTDLKFGTREEKGFDIIVGLETMKKMKVAKLRGLHFTDVYE